MARFVHYHSSDLIGLTNIREGESKLGQKMCTVGTFEELKTHQATFVLLGLPEDVGVRANGGKPGASSTWMPTLAAICNIQSTSRLSGENILVLGHFDFAEEMALAEKADQAVLREIVKQIDGMVFDLMLKVFEAGKVPIIIGGGHNNAYPLLKARSIYQKQAVNALNIDAHADFRKLEGRHSGNGFSYAFQEGYLDRYAVLGLHENYNAQYLINELNNYPERIFYTFFEDFLIHKTNQAEAFERALQFVQGVYGLELDVDSIAGVAASASSPSGFTVEQVRSMIYQTQNIKPAYFHICEGVAENQVSLPKLIAFLVSDFIKAQS